jgi:hypothetical protein
VAACARARASLKRVIKQTPALWSAYFKLRAAVAELRARAKA